MSLKNKLLGDGKQNRKIISENGKNYNSFNLKEKEFKNETKNQQKKEKNLYLLYETNGALSAISLEKITLVETKLCQ